MESEPYFKQAGSAWTSAACKHTDMYPFRLCTCTVYLHYHRILVYAFHCTACRVISHYHPSEGGAEKIEYMDRWYLCSIFSGPLTGLIIGYQPNCLMIAVRASLPQAAVDLEADTVELAIARCDGQSEGPYTAQRVRRELGPTRTTQKSYNRSVAAAHAAAVAP